MTRATGDRDGDWRDRCFPVNVSIASARDEYELSHTAVSVASARRPPARIRLRGDLFGLALAVTIAIILIIHIHK